MTATQDLFSLSFGPSRADAKHYDRGFTAERILNEVRDLLVNPLNSKVAFLRVRRGVRSSMAVPAVLGTPDLSGGNGHAGWGVQALDASRYDMRGFFTSRHEVLAEKLVELLANRGTEIIEISW